jgi:hypothetical protein
VIDPRIMSMAQASLTFPGLGMVEHARFPQRGRA